LASTDGEVERPRDNAYVAPAGTYCLPAPAALNHSRLTAPSPRGAPSNDTLDTIDFYTYNPSGTASCENAGCRGARL